MVFAFLSAFTSPPSGSIKIPALSHLPISLPAATPDPSHISDRNNQLEKTQALYNYASPPPIPHVAFLKGPVNTLPNQMPSFSYQLHLCYASAKVLLNCNCVFSAIKTLFTPFFTDCSTSAKIESAIATISTRLNEGVAPVAERSERALESFRTARTKGSYFEESSFILEPYRDLYHGPLKCPPLADVFLEDSVFARLRVAGYNPMSLYRVNSEAQLPFKTTQNCLYGQDTIPYAISQKRLYALDFSCLKNIEQDADSEKIIPITKSLFVVSPKNGQLLPVAIDVDGDTVYCPRDADELGIRWTIAKTAVNSNDAMHHELVTHLGRTHLLVEPFIAATMRRLPSVHPLHVLLRPHFEGTVFINDLATHDLLSPGGPISNIFAGDMESMLDWMGKEVAKTQFNACMPDVEMKARGVDDNVLQFPYREDALEHFDALHQWVSTYLSFYYDGDESVVNDSELKEWAKELVDGDCGRVKDFGDDGQGEIRTLKYLIRAVTFVVFSASVQHAAVNFPQARYMSYAPAVAGGLYAKMPKAGDVVHLDSWEKVLTPIKVAVEQIKMIGVIGTIRYTRLGNYRWGELPKEKKIANALALYKRRLAEIDSHIEIRERDEKLKYDFMRPGLIPQSINI